MSSSVAKAFAGSVFLTPGHRGLANNLLVIRPTEFSTSRHVLSLEFIAPTLKELWNLLGNLKAYLQEFLSRIAPTRPLSVDRSPRQLIVSTLDNNKLGPELTHAILGYVQVYLTYRVPKYHSVVVEENQRFVPLSFEYGAVERNCYHLQVEISLPPGLILVDPQSHDYDHYQPDQHAVEFLKEALKIRLDRFEPMDVMVLPRASGIFIKIEFNDFDTEELTVAEISVQVEQIIAEILVWHIKVINTKGITLLFAPLSRVN